MQRLLALLLLYTATCWSASHAQEYNVRNYGAKGDGVTVDGAAINAAIEAAAAAGGGTVRLPAGRYLSYSIRLKSNINLELDAGCVLVAASPVPGAAAYDPAEPNPFNKYQDFGHSHWQNSLIWGIGLENVSITGLGMIDGTRGLTKRGPRPARPEVGQPVEPADPGAQASKAAEPTAASELAGEANKAIALKLCRNVVIKDVSILNGGHFALLATGLDNLTISNVKVDTNRDGFDIDACRNVRISDCSVNAPNDDAICLKSSFALGEARACENITITNCQVSGFDIGSFLDGTYKRTSERAPDRDGPTGRIKFGTESSGGFRNIAISNCVFVRSRGIALETVDGGAMEDISISNIVMREITTAPIFIRLGNRARSPEGTPVSVARRIRISQLTAYDCDARYPVLVVGLPGHPVEDVVLSDIRIVSRGGLTMDQVAQQPEAMVNRFFMRGAGPDTIGPRDPFAVPERETAYPEPSMFGLLPASAVYARHVRDLVIRDYSFLTARLDERPRIVLEDATNVRIERFEAPGSTKPTVVARAVQSLEISRSTDIPDTKLEHVTNGSF